MEKSINKKPLLIYDGDCNFCRRWINRWSDFTCDRVDYAPSQKVADQFPQIPKGQFLASVQLIETDGKVYGGAEAVFRTLTYSTGKGWLFWLYRKAPGVSVVTEWFYRFVAQHRKIFSKLTTLLWGEHLERPTYFLAQWLFLRLIGLIYLTAFISLGIQMTALSGDQGILPVNQFLQMVSDRVGNNRYHLLPTLCWFNSSDAFLNFLCWGGAFLSFLLILDFAPAFVLFTLWLFYLSLSSVCQDFLWFQWDTLLLETGFLAALFAPARILPKFSGQSHPSSAALWLLRWLLFRLMFESGCVKLLSGDLTWQNLTALTFHYETQPLPTWIGWYAHQLPVWFQKMSGAVMFGIELIVPFFIFFPRRLRSGAFFTLAGFQILIILTGNYCFFNWLTIALCLPLLDDNHINRFLPHRLAAILSSSVNPKLQTFSLKARIKNSLVLLSSLVILLVSGTQLIGTFVKRSEFKIPLPLAKAVSWASPFRTINSYGLFAVMTTVRHEIVIEGSNDGKEWMSYEFKWKPGDLKRPPSFVAPHQPRLDWQMWFAALSGYQNNPWFMNFLVRLLQGSPPVLSLLEKNPFPDKPPQYIRSLIYEYHFTDRPTKRSEGTWWRRELKGLYSPPIALR